MYIAKRGMIVWFDSSRSNSGDKTNATIVSYDGTEKATRYLTGRRPHIIISCDDINEMGTLCTMVPCRSYPDNRAMEYSTVVHINERECSVDVRYITSIEQAEICPRDFVGFLEDKELNRIDECLVKYLIGGQCNNEAKSHTLFMGVDIEKNTIDPVVSTKPNQMADAINKALSESNKNEKIDKKQRSRKKWTLKEAKVFMEDYDTNSTEFVMAKYGLTSRKAVYNTKYRLMKTFGDHLVK